ncbi:5747_t:CDS:2 [Entrophospora sp. SA101]|nr:5747_t:CDS:2 [Entrophospora sp. SA101]
MLSNLTSSIMAAASALSTDTTTSFMSLFMSKKDIKKPRHFQHSYNNVWGNEFKERGVGSNNNNHNRRYNGGISTEISGGMYVELDNIQGYRNLSKDVSQQIFKITNNVASIQKLVGYLGTSKDTQDVRSKLHTLTEETRHFIKKTNDNIKALSQFEGVTGQNRQRKLEQQKLSKDFQKTLAEFQKVQRVSAEKQREYVDKAKSLNIRNDAYEEEKSGAAEEQPLIDDSHRRLQLQVLDNEIEYNESLIAEREGEIREVEQGINELNEIFRDLGTLVTEQQSMLDNIESNVTNIAVNVRSAADELNQADKYQRKARNRKFCLLIVCAIVVAFVFFALLQ